MSDKDDKEEEEIDITKYTKGTRMDDSYYYFKMPPRRRKRRLKMKLSEFKKKFGEGTDFDLDYGKIAILALCIYIAVQVS